MRSKHIQTILSLTVIVVLSGCGLLGGRSIQEAVTPTAQAAAGSTPALGLPTVTPMSAAIPQVTIASPNPNQQFQQGQPVTIVSTAVDAQGITKIELFVDGELLQAAVNPQPQPNQPFLANQPWQPEQTGMHVIQVKAYNPGNAAGESLEIFVEIVESTPSATVLETDALSDTTTSETGAPEADAPDGPYLVMNDAIEALNIRSGPSTDYDRIGTLTPTDQAVILGQSDVGTGRWWQISYAEADNGVGWIIDNAEWITAYNTDNVAQVTPPPTPAPVVATPGAPVEQVVFQEDFSTNEKNWLVAEVDNEYGQSKQGLVDEQYQLSTVLSKQQVWEKVALPQLVIGDFLLNFKASVSNASGDFAAGPPALGASFWRGTTQYAIYFSNPGYQIRSSNTADDAELAPTAEWTSNTAINLEPGVVNDFSILTNGSNLTLYANGTELTTLANAPTDRPGPVWLISYLPQANQSLTVNFDEIEVKGDPDNVGENVVFQAGRTTIKNGECVTLSWWTGSVQEVYYQGEGVPGAGDRQECPAQDTVYRLEVVNPDGSRDTKEVSISLAGCLDSGEFVNDINFGDGSAVVPGQAFTKKWRIKNTGTCTWDGQYRWTFDPDSDNQVNFGVDAFPFEGAVGPGQEVEIEQELTPPTEPGMYAGRWTLNGPNLDGYTAWVGVNLGVGGIPDASGCLDAGQFLEDVTYPDGSPVSAGETFTKKWRIKNSGTCTWDENYFWSFSSSADNQNTFGVQTFPLDTTVNPGQEFELTQDLVAPQTPGEYVGQWLLLKQGREVSPAWVSVNIVVE